LFEKILVPLDGSAHSINALEKAVQIAKKFDGKITLIHAYSTDLVPVPKEYSVTEATPEMVEVSRYKGANILAEAQIRAQDQGVSVETLLRAGKAVENIVEASKTGKFDLIVMGARGLSPLKEILLGNVSHGVTTHAPCPILVVK
jgi:nucleotide-binding universal stress UspA family protein